MTPRKTPTNHRERLVALKEQLYRLGLQGDPLLQFYLEQCLSPIERTASKFYSLLSKRLSEEEFRKSIFGNESVPNLSPDTSIEIGKTVGKGLPFRVSIAKVMHWLISGASGSGKTNLICVLERAVRNFIACTLIDHKDEGLRFINEVPNSAYYPLDKQRWNPLKGVGNQTDYIRYFSSLLTRMMALLPVTANAVRAQLLNLCSDQNNLPAISDLAGVFQKLAQQEMRSSLHTASRCFGDLAVSMGRWADVRTGQWPFGEHMLNVIPLKDMPAAFEHFYISLLLKHMTDQASVQGHSTALRHILFFDEALTYMGKEMEPAAGSGRTNQVAEMMRTSRSYGISIIAAVQSLSKIQDSVIDNAGIFIAFRANSVQEAKICCKRMGFDESRYPEILNLETGTAWITSQCHQPIKIKVPFVDLGDYPSDADIARRMEPSWVKWDTEAVFAPEKSDQNTAIDFRELLGEIEPKISDSQTNIVVPENENQADTSSPEIPEIPQPQYTPPILKEYFALLQSSSENPDYSATAHYKSLGLSARRGNRIKAKIIELGWVEAVRASTGKSGRPAELLKPTKRGRKMLK